MIKLKILSSDIEIVAKAIILNPEGQVLFLKRSDYVDKFAGEWDLPGGHLKQNESLTDGLTREVYEETGLVIKNSKLMKTEGKMNYFLASCNESKVSISHEHVGYKFFKKTKLDISEKFQKIAFDIMEKLND